MALTIVKLFCKSFVEFKLLTLVFSVWLLFNFSNNAQNNIYWIELTNKSGTKYSIENPEDFLTERAIARRNRQNISITTSDLPVSAVYSDSINNIGAKIVGSSKWLNALMVSLPSADTSLIDKIDQLSFVKEVELTYRAISTRSASLINKHVDSKYSSSFKQLNDTQITIHNGDYLHNKKFTGEGMLIALMDGGFSSVNKLITDTIFSNKEQILANRNFLACMDTCNITEDHGTNVLSVIWGSDKFEFTGSAPDASFILCHTENSLSENPVEADNWIIGVEFADSLGADIISTSLGYGYFDDSSFNFPFSQFDGKTLRISQAANIAASKGILLSTSAGNEGNREWQKLLAPAEADSVLAVAAITRDLSHASFSSFGPTLNNYNVKPNVAAVGKSTIGINSEGGISAFDGTSFSTPIISGLAACLWQAFPELKAWEIKALIEQSSNQYLSPDTILGYGIPDFKKAYQIAQDTGINHKSSIKLTIFPNPVSHTLYLKSTDQHGATVALYDLTGKEIAITLSQFNNSTKSISVEHLPPGIYILHLQTKEQNYTQKIVVR